MLVVISDLHFEEEESDFLADGEVESPYFPRDLFRRNTPAEAYRRLIAWLAHEAHRSGAKRMDLVLAGDIFDLHRTTLWFTDNPHDARPYVGSSEGIDGALETKIRAILTAIAAEEEVKNSLEIFQLLSNGRYRESPDGSEQAFPAEEVMLHYIPGNHDRLANATPQIRNQVRNLLGLEGGDAPFPRVLAFDDPGVFVRHGHEYDRYNFSVDHSDTDQLPVKIPDLEYDAPAFGDFITVEVAARLPSLFRNEYGDSEILESEELRTLYLRLLRFDDLRPQSALLNFLLNIRKASDLGLSQEDIWKKLAPIAKDLLNHISEHRFLRHELDRLEESWRPDVIDIPQDFLASHVWKTGMPLWLVRHIQTGINAMVERDKSSGPERFAAREEAIQTGSQTNSPHFIVAGHTHKPQVELLAADAVGEQYYVNTGTWRNLILSNQERTGFGRLKGRTHVIFYNREERQGALTESFDYWEGTYRID